MPTVYPSLARARSLSEKPDRTLPGNEGIGLRIQNLGVAEGRVLEVGIGTGLNLTKHL